MENEMHIVASHFGTAPVDPAAILAHLCVDYTESAIRSGESAWIERQDRGGWLKLHSWISGFSV